MVAPSYKLTLMVASLVMGSHPITFKSEESRTLQNGPVFNRVQLLTDRSRDIWLMQQSHAGLALPEEKRDRLAIVVDKTKNPYVARFYQFEPGALEFKQSNRQVEFRASCFTCHANGPRALRPDTGLSPLEQLRVALWNVRIKSYGVINYDPIHDGEDTRRRVPFRSHWNLDNDALTLQPCLKCHGGGGPFARNYLRRQQAETIRFLIQRGHMPPLPFTLSRNNQEKILDFTVGL